MAKSVFQLHGVDERGHAAAFRQLRTVPDLHGSVRHAYRWARKLMALGDTVRLMAPQFVKHCVKSNKNDERDAEAICEAVTRPNMRFAPIRNAGQQAVLSIYRAREGFVKARTAQGSQIRGLLSEFGIIIPKGFANVYKRISEILEDGENGLPGNMRQLIQRLTDHLKELDNQVVALEREIEQWRAANESSRELAEAGGIEPLTASALAATVGDAKNFDMGSQMAARIGLAPKQHSSCGEAVLPGISKRGDTCLRTLLIHGARAVMRHAKHKPGYAESWLGKLIARRGKNVASVALVEQLAIPLSNQNTVAKWLVMANKNVRIAWTLLAKESKFRPDCAEIHTATA